MLDRRCRRARAGRPDGEVDLECRPLAGAILELAGQHVSADAKCAGVVVDAGSAHDRRDGCVSVERDADRRRGLARDEADRAGGYDRRAVGRSGGDKAGRCIVDPDPGDHIGGRVAQ